MAGVDYKELINSFLNSQTRLVDSSKREYSYSLGSFLDFLGEKELTRTEVANYINYLEKQEVQKNGKKKKLAISTISHKLTIIKRFAHWLWEEDKIIEKELKKIRGLQFKIERGEDNRRALTLEEEERGMEVIASPILRMMFWTGLNYGLRRSEHIKLVLDDVVLDKRVLTIRHSKENKTRKIKILRKHVPRWKQWFKTRESYSVEHDYVFFTDKGKAGTRTLERYFNKISEIIHDKPYKNQDDDERITSHTLRYTYAVKCWRGGMDLFVLSKMLGHESLETTQTYLRVKEEEILDSYEKQANLIL